MQAWRRLIMLATAAAVAFVASASTSWGQASPPSTAAPPVAPVPADVGGDAPEGAVVHSWALAPASGDPSQGNRPYLSYEVAPGTEIDDEVTLFNYSNVMLTFRLYATDAFNNDDGAFDLLPADKKPSGVGTWVQLPQAAITLPPRSQATMPVTIRVPATARPGDHAGAVLASSQAQGTAPDRKVITLDRRTGTRMYLRVAGALAPELAVEDLSTSYGPSLNPLGGRTKVTYRIVNRGNVRMGGTYRVSVAGPFGVGRRARAATELPELLPGESVTLDATFGGVPAAGLATAKVELDPEPVGRDVDDPRSASRRSSAIAVPFTLLALVVVAWLVTRARRSYLRHRHEEVQGAIA